VTSCQPVAEQDALVVLVRLQVAFVRDEIGGHRPDPTGADRAAPREIPVVLLDPVA